jgi:hypothetical protein
MGCGKRGWVIAKGKETKDMREECTVASRPEGSGSEEGSCAQIVWRTSRLASDCPSPEKSPLLQVDVISVGV